MQVQMHTILIPLYETTCFTQPIALSLRKIEFQALANQRDVPLHYL